jgi:hypothetical protein
MTGVAIEDFRGDFDAVAAMMEESWGEAVTAPLLYSDAFLRSCFDYPGASFELAPAIYEDDRPVAFVAGFPRRVRYAGTDHAVLLITFLTAAAEHRSSGYGIVIWSELVRRAREAGFDGMVNYCVEGEAMNRMIVPACRRLRLPVVNVYSAHYLSRMLSSAGSGDGDGAEAPTVEDVIDATAPLAEQAPLARTWTEPEVRWQLTRLGAVATAEGDGSLTGYVMEIANARRTRCLMVEDILWGELDDGGRESLVRRFAADAAATGARLAVVPQLGYADTAPFAAAGFRPSGRIVHMYLSLWGDAPPVEPVSSCYLDVL